jgi:predicted  nucleic acid-binding Zn-ribbon protein
MDEQVRQVYERLAPDAEEAMIADLTEAAELEAVRSDALRRELEKLQAERKQLSEELDRAQVWIRELAAELERSPLPVPESGQSTFRERIVAAQARLFDR